MLPSSLLSNLLLLINDIFQIVIKCNYSSIKRIIIFSFSNLYSFCLLNEQLLVKNSSCPIHKKRTSLTKTTSTEQVDLMELMEDTNYENLALLTNPRIPSGKMMKCAFRRIINEIILTWI